MARQEQHREDILREATALVERIEFQLPGTCEPVIVGFRRDGSPSFFFGAAFVVQFNSRNELRRAYWNDRLVKADHGRLYFMERVRSASEVTLKTTAFTEQETDQLLGIVTQQFHSLATAIRSQDAKTLRQVPQDKPLAPRILSWLDDNMQHIVVAQKPNVV